MATDVLYIAIGMVPELLQPAAQIIQADFVLWRADQLVFRTLPMAGEQAIALATLPCKSC